MAVHAIQAQRDAPGPQGIVLGREYSIDALGCDPLSLQSIDGLSALMKRVIDELGLHLIDEVWHRFPEPGGVTGLVLLSESHLTVHTFPEHGAATFNLYCCRPKPDWPWTARLREALGAADVRVRSQRRG